MASNVVSDNFETGSGGVPQLGGTGATTCKAWVNFNQTGTQSIRDSYNVSSLTDNGSGKTVVNFTNAMANSNYAVASESAYVTGYATIAFQNGTPTTSSSAPILVGKSNNAYALIDTSYLKVVFFGD